MHRDDILGPGGLGEAQYLEKFTTMREKDAHKIEHLERIARAAHILLTFNYQGFIIDDMPETGWTVRQLDPEVFGSMTKAEQELYRILGGEVPKKWQ